MSKTEKPYQSSDVKQSMKSGLTDAPAFEATVYRNAGPVIVTVTGAEKEVVRLAGAAVAAYFNKAGQ